MGGGKGDCPHACNGHAGNLNASRPDTGNRGRRRWTSSQDRLLRTICCGSLGHPGSGGVGFRIEYDSRTLYHFLPAPPMGTPGRHWRTSADPHPGTPGQNASLRTRPKPHRTCLGRDQEEHKQRSGKAPRSRRPGPPPGHTLRGTPSPSRSDPPQTNNPTIIPCSVRAIVDIISKLKVLQSI